MKKHHLVLIFFCIINVLKAQSQSKIPTVGFLDAFKDETLEQATKGYFDALKEKGFSENQKTLKVIYENAQGEIPNLVQMTDYMIAQKVDVIATNPTLPTLTALKRTKNIPICMMVSPKPNLVGLVDENGIYPKNLFGIYDDLDYLKVSINLIKETLPSAKKIGLIYNQAEPQSVRALKDIKKAAKESSLEIITLPVNNSSETQQITQSLLSKNIDAFFAMPDNVVFASFEVIFKTCSQANVPVFTSEEGLVKRGAVVAYGADMYQWGYEAGLQTAEYFESDMKILPKIAKISKHNKIYNPDIVSKFNLKITDEFQAVVESKVNAKNIKEDFQSFYLSAVMLGLGLASLGMGIFISMRIFDIPDITTDGSYTLGASLTAIMLVQNLPLPLIILVVFLGGALAGMCTGLIHAKLKVDALLAGILMMTALYSINLSVMQKSNIPLSEDTFNILNLFEFLGSQVLSQFLVLALLVAIIFLILTYILRTDFGLSMRATGNAESMIRANGVNTDLMKIIGLGLANALIAFSGFLIVQYQGFADINMGIGVVIIGLGSVMIGETLSNWFKIKKIYFRILGVILGTIVFRLILALTLDLGVHPNLLKLVTAVFVLVVVALPNLRKK